MRGYFLPVHSPLLVCSICITLAGMLCVPQEWEKAMRGTDGRLYPWGNDYDPARLNNADQGPFATMPVGSFPPGASPYGVLDGAGQVYEWTATQHGENRRIVKGGSWDDHGGICRPAAWHSRPEGLKHILIGFRLIEPLASPRLVRPNRAR